MMDIDKTIESLKENIKIRSDLPKDVLMEVVSEKERLVVMTNGQMLLFDRRLVIYVRAPDQTEPKK